MSVPFSNTHLRVPQGFGTILEGLAREVLRNQPEDIPKYAAQYFDALLKKREESGRDPAEWAAKLEDRFYNNHAFKTTGQPSPEKETETDLTKSKEKSQESQAEDDLSHSPKDLNHSTTQPNVSEEVSLTERSEEDEEEEAETELGISEEESVNRLPVEDVQSDELSATEEEKDPSITKLDEVDREPNENESSSDMPQSDLESTDILSLIGVLNVDVCAQELGTAEDAGGDEPQATFVDKEILDSEEEENPEVEEPVEVLPYSGLAGVDVCAAELGGTEKKIERATADSDTHAGEIKFPSEETLVRSSLHHISESNQQDVENKEDKTNPEEAIEIEASFEETHEHIAHIEDGIAMPKQDSLDENSFEDNVTIMSQIISGAQDEHDELEKDRNEKEVNSEEEEVESQHEASVIMEEKVDINVSNLNDSDDDDDDDADDDDDDDEKGEGVKNISSPHQPTTEADKENPEDETDHKNEDNNMISEGKLHQNDNFEKETLSNDDKEEETTDMVGRDKEDIHAEGYSEMDDYEINDGDVENLYSQATQSNIVTTAMETESETFEASAQHLPEENKGSHRTLVETQPEDTMEENECTSKEEEELVEQEAVDSEIQEKSDAVCEEENISLTHSADGTLADHQGEERPLGSEKDTIEPEGLSSDKQEECSRPQEEEDIMDIPLDDPEANRAAAKIQAGFRGHMTRKKMKPEDKTEGEEVSSTGDVLNGSQGDTETGGSGAVERDDTSVPEQ